MAEKQSTKAFNDHVNNWKNYNWSGFTKSETCWQFSDSQDRVVNAIEADVKNGLITTKQELQPMKNEIQQIGATASSYCDGCGPKYQQQQRRIPGINTWF